MPEYKRFIAYFYEYIDGKKQKNAGFAKVELRNGMWRILFRIKTEIRPEPLIQVYGFVRTKGYLLGFPMGMMPEGCEISEEWAYGEDNVIGQEVYRFADLSGIWIQSGDGRKFITVWDDDPMDVKQFVLQLPEKREAERVEPEEIIKAEEMKPGETETIEAEEMKPGETETIEAEEMKPGETETIEAEEKNPLPFCPPDDCITELFRKRRSFQPFPDEEIRDCVQILPCDVLMLQQKGWQIGRSSFLQHGYYHHHHLLLGKTSDGAFLLGVPGIRNAQEEYMAQIFGYERFKLSGICDHGKTFGYWCRRIENQPLRHA